MAKTDDRLGFDPLAWMNNEKKTNVSGEAADDASISAENADSTDQAQDAETIDDNQGNSMKELLQNSFKLLEPRAEELTEEFYKQLFIKFPGVKPLFKEGNISQQAKMLSAAIGLVVKNVDKPEVLDRALSEMGKKHQNYGALPDHYPAVAETLLEVMAEFAGDNWTDELQDAWTEALNLVAEKMIAAYEPNIENAEENTMVARKSTTKAAADKELIRIKGMVENMNAAVMMVDLDLVIIYMNKSAHRLMKSVEPTMQTVFPRFSADTLVGTCIDDFHQNPAHQRRLLNDPSNLPFKGHVAVGDLTMELNVTPVYDNEGNYVGATQEWVDVTAKLANEVQVKRMQSSLTGSQTATMMCDENRNVIFMNNAVVELLRNRESELRQIFPGFSVDNLMGGSIDVFHQNPRHQEMLLSDPSKMPYSTEIKVLDMHFSLNVTMVTDEQGKYMGNSVEWRDITEEKDAEAQIANLIQAASKGQLEQRLEAEKFEGFMKVLSEGINTMLDQVMEPIQEVSKVITALESGSLAEDMIGHYAGEFEQLQSAVNSSIGNLRNMVGDIRESSSQIASASGEISQGNTDLSQRTEEQAASLEETASSMEELTSTVKQNADNSRQANILAADAREQAEEGGKVIESTISAMTEINTASNKIEDIISVIDEIAFQTNLLALNAAVEAARAGEQGRGFAVVASEVRSLAQRSAAAAKEIKVLIKDSVEKVDEGSRLVDESGRTLSNIVNSVKKVSDIIAEIAAASAEQSSGIEQVNKAIMQLDEVTQQNAALVEQAAAASESMDEQAKNMNNLMEFFDTGDAVAAPKAAPVTKPRAVAAKSQAPAPRPKAAARAPQTMAEPGASFESDEWEEF